MPLCPRCETNPLGDSASDISSKSARNAPILSGEVKRAFGKAIHELQKGVRLEFPLARPMPTLSVGAEELRVKDRSGAFRVFCFAKSSRGVLVFHAFVKKTEKAPKRQIELGKKRLQEMIHEKA